jgi:hydroxymethylpyrimidine/phosphomethylpyrimidine kinase
VTDAADMPDAAAALAALGPGAVLLKGGHLRGERSPDLLWFGGSATWLEGPRLVTDHTHGTGCTLSAAIVAYLAGGIPVPEACSKGKAFVTGAITGGLEIGSGPGPVDPLWNWGRPP